MAQDEGKQRASSAADSTRQVAETVKDEASNVAGEVSTQVRSLVGQASDEVRGQVDQQRSRAADALRTTADEFASLADKDEYSRLTGELTRRAAEQARRVADYVERTRPAELVDQVRGFARRRPGAFLLAAAVAGAVVGRVLKGATSGTDQPSYPESSFAGTVPSSTAPTAATSYRSTGSGVAEPLPIPPASAGMTPTGSAATGGRSGSTPQGDLR